MPFGTNGCYPASGTTPIYTGPVYQSQSPSTYSPSLTMFWVNGESEAYSFPVSPGQSILMMDRNSMTIYSKSLDASGTVSFEIHDLVKREPAPVPEPVDLSGYVKADDLDSIIDKAVNKALSKRNWNRNKQKENGNGQ